MAATHEFGKKKTGQGCRYRADKGHGDVQANSVLSKRDIEREKKSEEVRAMKRAIMRVVRGQENGSNSHFRRLNDELLPGYNRQQQDLLAYGLGVTHPMTMMNGPCSAYASSRGVGAA